MPVRPPLMQQSRYHIDDSTWLLVAKWDHKGGCPDDGVVYVVQE